MTFASGADVGMPATGELTAKIVEFGWTLTFPVPFTNKYVTAHSSFAVGWGGSFSAGPNGLTGEFLRGVGGSGGLTWQDGKPQ
jgi:hypothetical protein